VRHEVDVPELTGRNRTAPADRDPVYGLLNIAVITYCPGTSLSRWVARCWASARLRHRGRPLDRTAL